MICGGRVTDDKDRRAMVTLVRKFINSDVCKAGYTYDKAGIYKQLPASTDHQVVITLFLLKLNLIGINQFIIKKCASKANLPISESYLYIHPHYLLACYKYFAFQLI